MNCDNRGTPSKVYECFKDDELIATGTIESLIRAVGISATPLRSRIDTEINGMILRWVGEQVQVYALYEDETLITTGSVNEIANEVGLTPTYLKWFTNPSVQKRKLNRKLIPLEGETVIERKTMSRYASKPAEAGVKVQKRQYRTVKAKQKPWRPSRHTKFLFNANFKKWGIEV